MTQKHPLNYAVQPVDFPEYPSNWNRIFSREAPLAIEIGFGNGAFLVEWARQNPGWNFVGIELSMASMERAAKRLTQQNICNARLLLEDARFAIRELFHDNTLAHVMMNFPDPWPKKRHLKRRLLDENFVQILAMTLARGCPYELVTDQRWYAEHALELFDQSPCFQVDPIETDPVRTVSTKYENKWRAMGRQSYRLVAKKILHTNVTRLLEDETMPHAFVNRHVTTDKLKNLVGFEHKGADILFVIKAVYTEVGNPGYLVKVIAKDQDFQQKVLIGIFLQADNRWLVKLDPTIQPYRTPAVKKAVWRIGELLNS